MTPPAESTRATLEKNPFDVAAMFDRVARRYDLANDVLALGQVDRWRRATVEAIAPQPGETVLDLAAGTGTSSAAIARTGALVVPMDLSAGMLAVGAARQRGLAFVRADGTRLPLADHSVDAATISFGLRNVHDADAALHELVRVVRPGGRIVICEFSTPTSRVFRTLYQKYLVRALPAIARRIASNPAAYEYLAESILAWPDQAGLRDRLADVGLDHVQSRDLTGGIVALHRGWVPESA